MEIVMNRLPPFKFSVISISCTFLFGCVTSPNAPDPLIFDRKVEVNSEFSIDKNQSLQETSTQVFSGPKIPEAISGNLRIDAQKKNQLKGPADLTVSLEQIPIHSFIHAVYGGILKKNYSIDASIMDRKDLVTFRTPKPISAERLMEVSNQLLRSYGIAVQDLEGVIRITAGNSISSTLPLILRGRAQPTVPQPLRPIFHYIETEAVKPESFMGSLRTILGEKVKIEPTQLGGLLLSGTAEDVQSALELVQVFDQPSLRGQHNVRIVPRFWGADDFARKLSEVLRAEGYSVGAQNSLSDPINIITLPQISSVIIFSANKEVLIHAVEWAKELDQLNAVQAGGSLFTYSVKNSDAQELAKALNELIQGGGIDSTQSASANSNNQNVKSTSPKRVVVNNATNSLIFQGGTQDEYRQWVSLLTELDKPSKSALIDVLVAEVSLKDENDLGFTWKLDQLGSGASAVKLSGTTYGMNMGSSGLSINALLGGNPLRQLAINALASNSDSRVISNPKIVTKNGETANINVGEEVPTVTSQAVTSNTGFIGGNNTIVPQTVQYRSTGILLKVRPVIHSGDRIDIEVSQEVSSAQATVTGVTTSPTIRKRSVDTKISLRDGATIMLGGLISESSSDSNSGVPLLKDIPFIGNAFKSSKKSKDRTELVILITPYILNDSSDAEAATDAYNHTLGGWADSVRERVRASRKKKINDLENLYKFENIRNTDFEESVEKKNELNEFKRNDVVDSFQSDTADRFNMINIRKNWFVDYEKEGVQIFQADQQLLRKPNIDKSKFNNKGLNINNEIGKSESYDSRKDVGGDDVPQGAHVVNDPKLLKELMNALGK